jgi:hypothetical protein
MAVCGVQVRRAYYGSDAVASRRVCAALKRLGPAGRVAAGLYRVQKASSRAKVYRGGNGDYSFRELAYARKNNLLRRLCEVLAESGLVWGWGIDEGQPFNHHVLYVDLPCGQVSFHSGERMAGPDYPGQWDGKRVSEARVISYCAHLLGEVTEKRPTPAPCDVPPSRKPRPHPQPRSKPMPPPTWRCVHGHFGIRVEYVGEAVMVTLTAKHVFGSAQCLVRNREFVALATASRDHWPKVLLDWLTAHPAVGGGYFRLALDYCGRRLDADEWRVARQRQKAAA